MPSPTATQYVLITGAGSGIGLATAEHFIKKDWKVIAVGRTLSKLEDLKRRFSDSVITFQCDISDANQVAGLVSNIADLIPQIKALVNNAGVWKRLNFFETDDQVWRDQFENNILGSVRITRELLKLSIEKRTSVSVVNISSTLGVRPVADTSAYSAAKAAMVSWTQTLALEVAPHKIRVNCICPGLVDTPIHDFHNSTSAESIALRASLQNAQPIGRMGKPEDIASGIFYLASNESDWVTGSVLKIDGGISL